MNIATIFAILSITALGIIALSQGIDGALLCSLTAIIGGLGGYAIHKRPKP